MFPASLLIYVPAAFEIFSASCPIISSASSTASISSLSFSFLSTARFNIEALRLSSTSSESLSSAFLLTSNCSLSSSALRLSSLFMPLSSSMSPSFLVLASPSFKASPAYESIFSKNSFMPSPISPAALSIPVCLAISSLNSELKASLFFLRETPSISTAMPNTKAAAPMIMIT